VVVGLGEGSHGLSCMLYVVGCRGLRYCSYWGIGLTEVGSRVSQA
jgi:hypothetical protein